MIRHPKIVAINMRSGNQDSKQQNGPGFDRNRQTRESNERTNRKNREKMPKCMPGIESLM